MAGNPYLIGLPGNIGRVGRASIGNAAAGACPRRRINRGAT